ncbi:FAD-binding oxidoreductase [Solihabitans fulvus]|uniref:Delta(24)-sterol reductase n=1 Tax=Solihabitans fulvus TaxID=1892852 RepID=A0A5B2WTW6_9PSEU|nr:FAD-binding oxidoreductase [Solihabitans fulvus]KAA2254294.1 FAD-binding oxidoreductase [Solihabitans fulvus]
MGGQSGSTAAGAGSRQVTTAAGAHRDAVAALRAQYAALPPRAPVRLAKSTSNLFRFRAPTGPGLDVSAFNRVLSVDPDARTADVQGMVTYEQLVDATLPHGLMPFVVPQLKTITLGGAVAGLGIESSSFRNGLPHESVREMEILTGDGQVLLAGPDTEHADLFHGFPNSYGTLGYALRLLIDLQPVRPYVRLRQVPFGSSSECADAIAAICANGELDGEPVDFIDGTVFSGDRMYLTLGDFTDSAPWVSDYTGMNVYYLSIPKRRTDYLTVRDYLWRWDTDWFWCSKALGVQQPMVRRLWPKKYLRSDVYRRIVALDRRYAVTDRISTLRGQQPAEPVIQDIEVPVDRLAEFLDFFHREVGISPVWLCPLKVRDETSWPLYPLDPSTLYVNVGFWATVTPRPGEQAGGRNRLIERKVAELGGHKSLYSTSYYSEEEFWAHYNGPTYRVLKESYDPQGRLPDLYGKCVRGS